MTSFLRINGIDVPVADGSAVLSQEDVGSEHKAVDGTPVFNRRRTIRKWSFRMAPQTSAVALAFRDLITGKGHVLNGVGVASAFDQLGLYTSKGLAPTSLGGAFYSRNNNGKVTIPCPSLGAGLFACAWGWSAGYSGVWPMFTSTSPWSAWGWRFNAGVYHHYVICSNGAKWLDGVSTGTATGWLSVAAGVVTFGDGTATDMSDWVLVPFICPTDWPAQLAAFAGTGATYAQGALPRLNADGLFLEQNALISVKGKCGDLKAFQGTLAGSYAANLQDFSFELIEA